MKQIVFIMILLFSSTALAGQFGVSLFGVGTFGTSSESTDNSSVQFFYDGESHVVSNTPVFYDGEAHVIYEYVSQWPETFYKSVYNSNIYDTNIFKPIWRP